MNADQPSSDQPNSSDDLHLELGIPRKTTSPSIEAVAELAETFYDLFPDVTPQGGRDLAYFSALLKDFGEEVDLADELKSYAAWNLDRGTVKSPRASFRLWLKRARHDRRHFPRY